MKLSAKQSAFIDEYLVDRNATQAAIRAGYSASCARQTSSRLLAHADIRSEVRRRLGDLAASHEIDRDKVVEGLLEAIELAMANDNPSAAIRGWTELNKMFGFHEPVQAEIGLIPGSEKYQRYLETVPTEELLALAGGRMIEGDDDG